MASTVRSQLIDIIENHKSSIKCVSLTSDIWSSKNNDSFLSLTLQTLTDDMKMIRMVPFVSCFNVSHTAVNINLELTEMLGELGLLDKESPRIYQSTDNAANMKLAVKISGGDFEDVRCSNHLLHLAVEDSFKNGTDDTVKKANSLAVAVKRSPKLKNELKDVCKSLNIQFNTLKIANATRWNSKLTNLKPVIHLKKAITQLALEGGPWQEFFFSAGDWRYIEGIIELLEKINLASKAFEAEKSPTSNLVVYHLFNIQEYLKEYKEDDSNDG